MWWWFFATTLESGSYYCWICDPASLLLQLASCQSLARFVNWPHTLAQKYLIELLMWSASGVHKQSPKVWQAKVGWRGREKPIKMNSFFVLAKSQLFHLTKSAIIQIAKTVQWIETCWHWSSEEGPDATETGVVVLGLATSHDSQMFQNECRYVQVISLDYPKDTIESFVGHSSMGLLCPPAIIMQNR